MPGNSASLPPAAPHARWEATQGGLIEGTADCVRVSAAFERITTGLPRTHLFIHVLNSPSPAAFSFPDGSIYVARGLAERLTNDELAAAIAHELGHLLHDGVIAAPAALPWWLRWRYRTHRRSPGPRVADRSPHPPRRITLSPPESRGRLTQHLLLPPH